jgi:hypothetical protein
MNRTGQTYLKFMASLALLAFVGQSSAQLSTPHYVMRDEAPPTGSILPRPEGAGFPIPVDRRYDQLTPEQKAVVHSWYEHVEPGDEPPFPADGLAPLYDTIRLGQQKLKVRGDLEVAVTVGSGGDAIDVQVLKSPSTEMTEFAASILLMTKYKPAVCKGQPCRMQFPVSIRFDAGNEEDRIRTYAPDDREL